ncbi:protoporphyrinogen oxidase, mitochondrial isoform X2 [Cryptomeria japonica]|uniref:protoporphyrinogen oxidase, mitochondrial isoform X2 n=1 Tax=Cryptomeria japonica TaxID=3369 RepID=UPI0025AC3646|nr:protoporphyrinogen oxidase, mitochondrial isoform X2 [Cryptomeria japonica]
MEYFNRLLESIDISRFSCREPETAMGAFLHRQQESTRTPRSVAVLGGGVSGLAAAYKLKCQGVAVTVFEADERIGGKITSISQDGLIWEKGANTMTESEPEVKQLIDELGIRGQQQFPIMQNKRYIVKNGEPQLLPSNPLTLIGSKFLSARAKVNFYMEPILWKRRKPEEILGSDSKQESVGDFFRRHFGEEIVDYILDPFVAGTTGADTESVSMQHAFPEMWDLEERFGSIIIGGMRSIWSRKKTEKDTKVSEGKKRQRGSFSFMGGLQTLTNALSTKLEEESLKLQSSVLSLSCDLHGNPSHSSWSINYARNGYKDPVQEESFDAVIMTVTYLPISVIITTFKKQDVQRPLEGFGILVPSKEEKNGFQTLGTIFSSSMFPDRAPSDQYLFTTLIGGSRNKNLAKSSSKELQEVALNDLNRLLGIEKYPLTVKHVYWSEAFPLYSLNHNLVLDAIDKIEKNLPGLYFAGNYRGGLSVGKALVSGFKAADLAIKHLRSLDGTCEP